MLRLSLLRSLAAAVCAASVLSQVHAAEKDIVTTAVEAGSFKTLAAALEAAGLVETLQGEGPFTVFAPTDEAFARLPEGTVENLLKPENKSQLIAVLTYHVVSGKVAAADVVKLDAAGTVNGQRVGIKVDHGNVFVDQAQVVTPDIHCSNGIIHVIDQVILPTTESIPAIATNAGNFSTLLAAAKAAGLVEALSGEGPLTVFAPTDAAFAALPKGTVESLLKPENKGKLAAILKYHVVAGRKFSTDLANGKSVETLEGSTVALKMRDGKPRIGDANIVAADIDAANGVIHVIDRVLLPPSDSEKKSVSQATHHRQGTSCQQSRPVVRYRVVRQHSR